MHAGWGRVRRSCASCAATREEEGATSDGRPIIDGYTGGMADGAARRMLDMAARAALRGVGRVEPNPAVGCVIADDAGRVLAIGHHQMCGGPHAEVEAVEACRRAGAPTRGTTVYCTLEPCAHVGKTGPCADLLIAAGVRRLVCARREPWAGAAGGAERLRAAGVEVEFTDASRAAALVGAPFAKRITEGLPWVIAKWAQTIDGCVATRTGESKWISNEYSRRRVHVLRGRVDAVMVGVGTVLADDPMLTSRGVPVRRMARRVVLDSGLRTPLGARLVESAGEAPVTIVADRGLVERRGQRVVALRERGVEIVGVGCRDGRVDAREAMAELVRRHEVTRVLVETGPTMLGALVRDGLIDEAHVYVGGMVVGDERARHAAAGNVSGALGDVRRMDLWRVKRIGGDVMLTYGRDAGPGARGG